MFDALVGALAPAMNAASDASADVTSLRAAIAAHSGHDEVMRALNTLRTDPTVANAVAGRSYWHSNGFAKLVLWTGESTGKLRLHLWPDGNVNGPPYQNIHNHRWALASIVLSGRLRVERFAVASAGDDGAHEHDEFRYDAGSPDIISSFQRLGRVHLRRTAVEEFVAGQSHWCDRIALHTVAPVGSALTATLVAQGPSGPPTALVYQRPNRRLLEDTGRPIASSAVMELAARAMDAIESTRLADASF